MFFFVFAVFILGTGEQTCCTMDDKSWRPCYLWVCPVIIFDCSFNTFCCVLRLQPAVSRGGLLHIGVSSKVWHLSPYFFLFTHS